LPVICCNPLGNNHLVQGAQLYRQNRLWVPGRHTGYAPDTRRTLPVDNICPLGSAARLRRVS
jgi:hypothetical protein